MRRLLGGLGKGLAAIVIVILAIGLLLAFTTIAPQGQTPVALAPTPAPGKGIPPPDAPPFWTPQPRPTATATPLTKPTPPVIVPKPRSEDAPIVGGAMVTLWPTTNYKTVVHEIDVIAIGTVKQVLPARWNTADGRRPTVYHNLPFDQQRRFVIYTPIVLEVERYLKAPQPPLPVIFLGQAGGQVGQDRFEFTGDPQTPFVPGDRVLVFLKAGSLNAIPEYPSEANPSFFNAGSKHVIGADGRARYREIDLPLEDVVRRVEEALR